MDGTVALGGASSRVLTAGLAKMTAPGVRLSSDHSMARDRSPATLDSDSSRDELTDGATDMNLYTADLMIHDRMEDQERRFEANRLAALARAPRPRSTSWHERAERAAAWFRVLRRGTAV